MYSHRDSLTGYSQVIEKKFTVMFFGTWGWGKCGLNALINCPKVKIQEVFTKWDGFNQLKDQVYHLSKENGIPCFNTDKTIMSQTEFINTVLSRPKPDFVISCCYDRIFSQKIIDYNHINAINIHPSLLPKYRGADPLINAIIRNDEFIGVSIHKIIREIDAGDIYLQEAGVIIKDEKTFEDLYNELGYLSETLIKSFFINPSYYIKNGKIQDTKEVSYAPRAHFNYNMNDKVKTIKLKHEKNLVK